jgi:hypothetical protein
MTQTNPAVAGPNGDGSKSLARESKLGNLANGAMAAALLYVADWLTGLDITPLPDVLEPAAVGLVATAIGLITSYLAKNRKA